LSGQLKGSINIDITAEPKKRSCDQTKKQMVGYDLVIEVIGGSQVTAAGVQIDITAVLPFAVDGEEESCDCNSSLDVFKVANIKTEVKTLVAIPFSNEESYVIAALPAHTQHRPPEIDANISEVGPGVMASEA